jgi:hypothetical protein
MEAPHTAQVVRSGSFSDPQSVHAFVIGNLAKVRYIMKSGPELQ